MAILLDTSQIIFQSLFAFADKLTQENTSTEEGKEEVKNIIRHVVLSQIQYYNKTYREKYGELVICCDGTNVWRKKVFPQYKANRKKSREQHDINWSLVFEFVNELLSDLYNNFEFRVVKTNESEGDDVIATLVKYYQENELLASYIFRSSPQPIMIVSGDHDYCQLHKYGNVEQINPRNHAPVFSDNPEREIMEKILRGDRGDGVPNVLSDDLVFVEGRKSKALRQTQIDKLITEGYEKCDNETIKKNWKRNACLIDFRFIPKSVEKRILEIYHTPVRGNEVKTYNYLLRNNCNQLLGSLEFFKPNRKLTKGE